MTTLSSRSVSRAGMWALLAMSASVSAQSDMLDTRISGRQALQTLGAELPQLAADHGIAVEELTKALRDDPTLWLTENNRLVYVDPAAPAESSDQGASFSMDDDDIPPEEAFNLASNPGADKTIYMDFTGHQSVNNAWFHNHTFPAYNTSGSTGTFSNSELLEIITWWRYVVEDFAPFDVNVTTIEPPISDLTRNGSGDQRFGMRCVITQTIPQFGGGSGGVALLNTFNSSSDTPCFAFNKGNNTGSMTVSHEVGHTFGLVHDGLNGSTYHPGTSGWGPIMGAPFGASTVQWSKGEYSGATTTQNDISIITNNSNGIDLFNDDHGDSAGSATPVPAGVGCPVPTPGTVHGLIERRVDVDAFSFTSTGGQVDITASPTGLGGNVDIVMTLLDGSGAEIDVSAPSSTKTATMSHTLAAGNYTILIDGGDRPDVYTDYGSRGAYKVEVSKAGSAIENVGGGVAGGFGVQPTIVTSGVPCGGNSINITVGAAKPNSIASLIVGVADVNAPFKGGILVPDPAPPGTIIGYPTGFLGFFSINAPWPEGIPQGFELFLQFWIPDATAVKGFAATDGVRITAP